MRHYREKMVPAKFTHKLFCDFCKSECENPEQGSWGGQDYEYVNVSLTKSVYCYGEHENTESIDLCPRCFDWIYKNKSSIRRLIDGED